MFKFIHAADIHLDSVLKGLPRYEAAPLDEIHHAVRRAFENLIAFAIDEEVAFLIIAGDLYDGDWKDYNSGLFLADQLTRLRDAGIAAFVISGNHDAANRMTKTLQLPKNPDGSEVMMSPRKPETRRLDEYGVSIHGRGFDDRALPENVTREYPRPDPGRFNIGLLHTSLDGETVGSHARYAPCKIDDLLALDYQYWALGHIHKRHNRHRHGQPPIVYPGNIQGRRMHEPGAKGCMLVTVDDDNTIESLDFTPVDVFRWTELELSVAKVTTRESLLAKASKALHEIAQKAEGRASAVRITLTGSTTLSSDIASNHQDWMQQLRGVSIDVGRNKIWLERVVNRTTPLASQQQISSDSGPIMELRSLLEELRNDEDALAEIGKQLDGLINTLPRELTEGEDSLELETAPRLKELLDEVEPFLLARLTGQEAS